jgi:hypothetical protein
MSPRTPLGAYPHSRLYGQAGSPPTRSKITIIRISSPRVSPFVVLRMPQASLAGKQTGCPSARTLW